MTATEHMTVTLTLVGDQLWKKIGESNERVELRLRKTILILESSKIPVAIVGLITESWITRDPELLGNRLKSLIENPEQ